MDYQIRKSVEFKMRQVMGNYSDETIESVTEFLFKKFNLDSVEEFSREYADILNEIDAVIDNVSNIKRMEHHIFIVVSNLGLKAFEHLFQEKIENCMKENEMDEVYWWQIQDREIFMDLLAVYNESEKNGLLSPLCNYYDELKLETELLISMSLHSIEKEFEKIDDNFDNVEYKMETDSKNNKVKVTLIYQENVVYEKAFDYSEYYNEFANSYVKEIKREFIKKAIRERKLKF